MDRPYYMHFGVGEDEDGFYYSVHLPSRYLVSARRFPTLPDATAALMDTISQLKARLADGSFRPTPEAWRN